MTGTVPRSPRLDSPPPSAVHAASESVLETPGRSLPGLPVLFVLLATHLVIVALFVFGAKNGMPQVALPSVFAFVVVFFCYAGLFVVAPNQAKVLQLFGAYRGSVKHDGLRFTNPFYTKKKVSLRTRNFETAKLKVNDSDGNPIEIGCVVVWRVFDSAEASFNVEDFKNYVAVQSEAALRNLATRYPYDTHGLEVLSLSGSTGEISTLLQDEVQERLQQAGIAVIEARISHLAYAPEIAAAMLQRQQAGAVVAARAQIVEGAVGMVEHALEMLGERKVVALDDQRRAAMVSNLLVVLCSDRHTQPVVNAGGSGSSS